MGIQCGETERSIRSIRFGRVCFGLPAKASISLALSLRSLLVSKWANTSCERQTWAVHLGVAFMEGTFFGVALKETKRTTKRELKENPFSRKVRKNRAAVLEIGERVVLWLILLSHVPCLSIGFQIGGGVNLVSLQRVIAGFTGFPQTKSLSI